MGSGAVAASPRGWTRMESGCTAVLPVAVWVAPVGRRRCGMVVAALPPASLVVPGHPAPPQCHILRTECCPTHASHSHPRPQLCPRETPGAREPGPGPQTLRARPRAPVPCSATWHSLSCVCPLPPSLSRTWWCFFMLGSPLLGWEQAFASCSFGIPLSSHRDKETGTQGSCCLLTALHSWE